MAAVVTLVLLLLLLDRAAEALTTHELAVKIQRAQHLSARPHVTVRGFPFLTQVLAGKYTEIDVSSDSPVTNRGVTLSSVSVRLHGVRVGLTDALHGNVRAVPVDNGTGTALLSYRDLDTILAGSTAGLGAAGLGAAITLTPAAPGHATVHGPLGITLTVGAAVTNDTLTITSTPAELSALPEPVRTLAATAIGAPLPLPAFPFNVHLTAGTLDAGGLHLTAAAAKSVFPTR